jgi:hypothetical protein
MQRRDHVWVVGGQSRRCILDGIDENPPPYERRAAGHPSRAGSRRSQFITGCWDHPTPTAHDVVRAVMRGTRRQLDVAQPQKTALELDAQRTAVPAIPADLRGLRDRALLLVGWAAALRRHFEPEGIVLTIRRSKTDREAPARASPSRWGEKKRRVRSGRCAPSSRPQR